jgi:ATP-binding cassette subfamily B protein/subfamily B ATP-binding cassette protein MsbA
MARRENVAARAGNVIDPSPGHPFVNRYPSSSQQRFTSFVANTRQSSAAMIRRVLERVKSSKDIASQLRTRPQYWIWLKPGFRELAVVVVWALLGIGFDMVWPLLSAHLIDHVINNPRLDVSERVKWLVVAALGMGGVLLVNSGLSWLRALKTQLVTSRLQATLRHRLYQQMLHLPLAELQELRTGGLLSRLATDVDNTAQLVQLALLGPALALLRLAVTLSIIFALNWRIASAVTLAVPPILFVQALWARRMRGIWRSIGQDRQELDARVTEALAGIRVVRGFRRERREQLEHRVGLHTIVRKQMLATRTQRSVGVIWDLIVPTTQVIIVCYGGYLVIRGQTTLGTVVAFQGYLWRLLEPVLLLINSITDTQRGLAAMDRVFDLLNRRREHIDASDAVVAPSRVESIEFDDVSFGYHADRMVLEHIDLRVAAGSVVALIGPSGAGKTTLTDLLALFYDPNRGSIRLNGIDLRKLRLDSYRGLLGVVAQDVFLFDGTVRDNIGYGRLSATEEAIEAAAKAANAHAFILQLPNGYDTWIGERGVKLSGGQRQRLSIARALLADPQILILDEATSNLDTESELQIQGALARLVAHRTTFVIAHRLSTIANADRIVVLDRGRIVETGAHAELMARGGLYSRMVELQQQETRQRIP